MFQFDGENFKTAWFYNFFRLFNILKFLTKKLLYMLLFNYNINLLFAHKIKYFFSHAYFDIRSLTKTKYNHGITHNVCKEFLGGKKFTPFVIFNFA